MSKFINKNIQTIGIVFTTFCFLVGLLAGNKYGNKLTKVRLRS
jgi:hypothetical protein